MPSTRPAVGTLAVLVAALCCCVLLTSGCGRSPADKLVDRSMVHLEAGVDMLKDHAPNTTKLLEAAMHYQLEHRQEFRKLRKDGEALMKSMSTDERKAFSADAYRRGNKLVTAMQTAAKKYPKPKLVLRALSPLMVTGTGVAPPKKLRSLLPPLPGLPGAGTPTMRGGDHHGH